VAIVIKTTVNGVEPEVFAETFLVHPTQPEPLKVVIVTEPNEAKVQWTLEPTQFSGTVALTQGETKDFVFTPQKNMTRPPRHKKGQTDENPPIKFLLTVKATTEVGPGVLGDITTVKFEITQKPRAVLRQEYYDYGIEPPSHELVAALTDDESTPIKADSFIATSNYAKHNLAVKGGMQQIAVAVQKKFGSKIQITSAFRNPQRNCAVGGALPNLIKKTGGSVHQSGGAVDMCPHPEVGNTLKNRVILYRSALTLLPETAKLVMLEKGPKQLLPGNWHPPSPDFTFNHNGTVISFEDADSDGLPDRVKAITDEPVSGILNKTLFDYPGNSKENPKFRIGHHAVPPNRIAVGDPLFLVWNLPFPDPEHPKPYAPLSEYFQNASHVHADTRNLPKLLTDLATPALSPRDEYDLYGTGVGPLVIEPVLLETWGPVENARRLYSSISNISSEMNEADLYKKLNDFASSRLVAIAAKVYGAVDFKRTDPWGDMIWPRIETPDLAFDWDYTTVVIHHSGNLAPKDARGLEALHLADTTVADIKYHFLVDRNGKVYEGRNLLFKGGHVANANTGKIGVLLLGDFEPQLFDLDDDEISENQLAGTVRLIKALKDLFPTLTFLGGHRDFLQTNSLWGEIKDYFRGKCPGELLYSKLNDLRISTLLSKP